MRICRVLLTHIDESEEDGEREENGDAARAKSEDEG